MPDKPPQTQYLKPTDQQSLVDLDRCVESGRQVNSIGKFESLEWISLNRSRLWALSDSGHYRWNTTVGTIG